MGKSTNYTWPFSIAFCMFTRGYTWETRRTHSPGMAISTGAAAARLKAVACWKWTWRELSVLEESPGAWSWSWGIIQYYTIKNTSIYANTHIYIYIYICIYIYTHCIHLDVYIHRHIFIHIWMWKYLDNFYHDLTLWPHWNIGECLGESSGRMITTVFILVNCWWFSQIQWWLDSHVTPIDGG